MDPPPLYSKMLLQLDTSTNSTNVTPWGNLKLWHDIGWFFIMAVYIKITSNNTYKGILKIGQQP